MKLNISVCDELKHVDSHVSSVHWLVWSSPLEVMVAVLYTSWQLW